MQGTYPIIEVKNLHHVYGEGTEGEFGALRGISFTACQGEFLTIIGHNGSGKSTLAKHLNALLLPTSGTVVVDNINTSDESRLWDIRQRVGMVFQNPDNQIVATTVEEDVAFGPENLGIPSAEIRERVAQALAVVGMTDFAKSPPHALSGGQKQRIAIAGVLAMRPKVIVLDEATAMLDPGGRWEVMNTVKHLSREEGITVVHITHFMDEAVTADRLLVMEAGQIVISGSPEEVFARVDELKNLQLDVPPVTELAERLRRRDVDVPRWVLTAKDMVSWLCQ